MAKAKQKTEPKRVRSQAQIESEQRTAKKNIGARRMPSGKTTPEEGELLDELYLKCGEDVNFPRNVKGDVLQKAAFFTAVRYFLKKKK